MAKPNWIGSLFGYFRDPSRKVGGHSVSADERPLHDPTGGIDGVAGTGERVARESVIACYLLGGAQHGRIIHIKDQTDRIGFGVSVGMEVAPPEMRYRWADEFKQDNGHRRILVASSGYSPQQHREMSAELAERALVQLD